MISNILSLIVFFPLLVALALFFVDSKKNKVFKVSLIVSSAIQFLLGSIVYLGSKHQSMFGKNFLLDINQFGLVEKTSWIYLDLGKLGKISIDYLLGVDGMNIAMVLLAGIIALISSVSSWSIDKNNKAYTLLFLLLNTSIMGCFVALDFFLFFLFFEFMLLPMYFLIGLWGGERRNYASIKFFLYTLLGSLLILLVMISLGFSVIDPLKTAQLMGINGTEIEKIEKVWTLLAQSKIENQYMVHSFSWANMGEMRNYIPGSLMSVYSNYHLGGYSIREIAFGSLMLGFLIKLPSVPFHTWLPDAHVEAPTPVSVVLAGVLLKIGGYGIIRVAYGLFPEAAIEYAWWIALLGCISIIYAALNALAMSDIKKMVAYSSVSHMGFVLLGIASLTSEGINGSVFLMFSHGIIAAMLFLVCGVLYERTHDRTIDFYRGLANRMPNYATLTTIAFFASLGLPGFSGFIGELFVLLGAFSSSQTAELVPRWMPVLATLGILIGAAYYLWTLQKMFFGKFAISARLNINFIVSDLTVREKLLLIPLAFITLLIGIFPNLLFDVISNDLSVFADYIIRVGKINSHF